jgi:hypothetical protein
LPLRLPKCSNTKDNSHKTGGAVEGATIINLSKVEADNYTQILTI